MCIPEPGISFCDTEEPQLPSLPVLTAPIKLPPALAAPQRPGNPKPVQLLDNTPPLDLRHLPAILIPVQRPRIAKPPLLHYGYPVSDKFLTKVCDSTGLRSQMIAAATPEDRHKQRMRLAIDYLREVLKADIRLVAVRTPGVRFVLSFSHNYDYNRRASDIVIEEVRRRLGETGHPMWYLDSLRAQFTWGILDQAFLRW